MDELPKDLLDDVLDRILSSVSGKKSTHKKPEEQTEKKAQDNNQEAQEVISDLQDLGFSLSDISDSLEAVNSEYDTDVTRTESALSKMGNGETSPPDDVISALIQIKEARKNEISDEQKAVKKKFLEMKEEMVEHELNQAG